MSYETVILARNYGHILKSRKGPEELADVRAYRSAVATARIFKLDTSASDRITWLANNHDDLIDSMRPWAKPPFDSILLDFLMWDGPEHGSATQIGLLLSNGWAWLHFWKTNTPYENTIICPTRAFFDSRGVVCQAAFRSGSIEGLPESEWARMLRVYYAFCLLLHAPKGVQITEKPAHRKLVKGKQKAYAAHSIITIDLSAKEARRVIADGSRGPIRAHEVRGHWMHLNRVRGCSHEWRAVPVEPDRPERYVCDCGTVRVWRKAHQKGDATLGYVTHQYHVTHGGHAC